MVTVGCPWCQADGDDHLPVCPLVLHPSSTFTTRVSDANPDLFTQDKVAVVGEFRVPATETRPTYKLAAWMPASREVLEDAPVLADMIRRDIAEALDRQLRPWLFRDPAIIRWTFDPFPRWTRLVAAWRSGVATTRRGCAAPARRLSSRLTRAANRIDPAGAPDECYCRDDD